ncbi:hypothetical protein QBC40DRAFT_228337 [Triangularia verruculosa]|uniref:Aminoglycoside phosphotransferase domain-containing protein n=1 Tax=Triangularia verruculosa TaxID=2587418 RepID=A0AAN6XF84_9PEZI|nr:hypothetical protein QBC40DRAFT_228337 [Triangularia verruculosa]
MANLAIYASTRRLNTAALVKRASKIRNGTPCRVRQEQYRDNEASSMMGTRHFHLDLEFEDGVTWIARIRQPSSTPPSVRNYMIKSEAATLGFLEHTKVPAPILFDYGLESPENPVGIGYILMEKLPGAPLCWHSATREQRRKVLNQLADIYIDLSRRPFHGLGSLDIPGSSHIGAFAKELTVDLPPCQSWSEHCTRYILRILEMIEQKEIYTRRSVDALLIHRFLLDLIPKIEDLTGGQGARFPYYLKHADEKMDHILIDEDYNITGVIDWESAYTAPACVAFNSPMGILPVKSFYDGIEIPDEDEETFGRILDSKGRQNFGDAIRHGRLLHRFLFCIKFDIEKYWDDFKALFRGLRDGVGVDQGLEWSEWRTVALQRYLPETAQFCNNHFTMSELAIQS